MQCRIFLERRKVTSEFFDSKIPQMVVFPPEKLHLVVESRLRSWIKNFGTLNISRIFSPKFTHTTYYHIWSLFKNAKLTEALPETSEFTVSFYRFSQRLYTLAHSVEISLQFDPKVTGPHPSVNQFSPPPRMNFKISYRRISQMTYQPRSVGKMADLKL